MLPVGSEIKHTVVSAMGASGTNVTKDEPQRPPRISVFFMAALAIRKFHKFKLNSFEKSLTLQFDKQAAIDELKLLSDSDQHFFKRHAVKLAYFIRKFEITSRDLSSKVVENIFLFVQDQLRKGYEDSDQTMLNFLCVALKFLTLNSDDGVNLLQLSSVVQLLKTGHAKSQVKNTLVSLLVVCFKKETEKQESGVSADLLNSIEHLPDLGPEASSLISSIAESVKRANFEADWKPARTMAVQKVTKSQQFISKTVQTVKLKRSSETSEEADFHFITLSENMKNRHRKTKSNAVSEELKEIAEQGNDRSMFRNTWNEVLHLYLLVSDGNILKDDDRNNYLPSKLFGRHYFWRADSVTGKLYSFFIERMCISTFLKVSKKQHLNDKTIEKLMKCITDFNCLVSLLKFGEYFVNTIVDLTYITYWEAKKLQSPDMAVKFFRECLNETTEEFVEKGWFFTSTKVRRKSYDAAVVKKLVCDEINNLRRDAVKAVYNCAVRNKKEVLTKERLEKILACTQNQEDGPYADQTFVDYIFKLNELAETLNDFNYKRTFQKYIDLLKKNQMPSHTTMNCILKFMNNQARDLQRSQELFTDENLITLFDCLTRMEDEKKMEILEIINILLEHESSKELSEKNLEKLTDCLQPNNVNLLKSSLTTLLLTINKNRLISQHVLGKLMSLFQSPIQGEECTCFIVFMLSQAFCGEGPGAEDSYLKDSLSVELVSSKLRCALCVELNDDDEGEWVRFEEPSDERHSSSKISLLAAKIIWRSVENKVPLSSETVDNLILALGDDKNNDEKQTKIMVAKCLYGLTEYMSFPRNDYLNKLLDLMNSPIYDVGIYVQTAYVNGCAKVASAPPPTRLDWIHLENISGFYVADDLMLGTIDFGHKINESFFKILLYEANNNQKFYDENIFLLFNSILYLNVNYVPQVLTILLVYTSVYVVPESTIKALENVLSVSSYSEKALQVLENVILAGKSSVSSKTLGVFADCLQSSTNSRLRFNSFKLLEQASKNQELPDRMFHQLELVKAGYALQLFHQSDSKQMIIDFIQKLVDKGVHLPIDTQKALEKEAVHDRVLKVWATTAKNKQLVDLHLMSILNESFKPLDAAARSANIFFLTIFEYAVKNNQDLPLDLIKKLEAALYSKDLAGNVLPIFIYLTQKGEHLSRSVNDKLLDKLMVEEDPTQKQELLSSLGSLIQANHENIDFYQSKINTILTKEITSNNQNIQRLCVNSITKLARASKKVDDELLDKLVEVGTSSYSNKTLKCEILGLFNSVFQESYNKSIRKKQKIVQLANLRFNSQEELLDQLRCFVDLTEGLLPQNYRQLKDILESESVSLQEKTLDLLHGCRCKIGMTDELLNSVAILYQRTISENVRKSCLHLLGKAVKNGKNLTGTAMEIHRCASDRDDSFKKFSQSRVGHELRRRLGKQTVSELLQLIQNNNHLSSVETLSDFISLVTEKNSNIPNEGSFVLLIEMCLLQSKSVEIALPCYCRIIKDLRKCDPKCLDAVVLYYIKGIVLEQPLQATLFESLYYASKYSTLSDVCMSFVLKNIDSVCYLTRGYAFGILKAAAVKEPKYESIFLKRCELLKLKLLETFRVDIGNLGDVPDLLEVIVSLAFIDDAIFEKNRNTWKRELLISDILEGLQASRSEKTYFYENWGVVEKKFTYHESCKILSLIQKCHSYPFSNLLELTCTISDFKFDELERLLTVHAPNPFQAVKQKWTVTQLLPRLPKDVSIKYSSVLAEKLCHSFDVKFIDKLFRSLESIDSVCAFENLISFCLIEKIDESMMWEKEFKLDDFRNSIEANHACRSAKSQPSECQQEDFLRHFVLLKNSDWSFFQLHELVRLFRPSKFSNLLSFLKTLLMYKLPSSYHEEIKSYVLEDSTFPKIMQNLNKLITQHHTQLVGKEKNLNEILTELKKLNPSDENLKHFIQSDSLDIQKLVFEKHADKLNWSEEQIRAWVEEVRERERKFENDEAIAVTYRGNFLITGHRLTHTQILCCLVALREGSLTSKLLQVATGEGKSTIICVLAIIIALRGTKVDVVTSSPVLAERDAKQKAKFYGMFGLSCSDNSDKTIYLKGRKDCYLADVVYGEMSQFQFDILRDNYSKLGTLGERKPMTAIIDEVDNMLIDDSSKVARLSSTVPGMDHLQAIYVFIWQHMLSVLQKFKMFDNKMYFVSGNVGFENDKITLEVADGENVLKYTDLEAYLAGKGEKEFFDEVIDSVDEYVRRKVQQFLDDQLKANQIYIPSNLANFVTKQKAKWVKSAIEALNYQENVHYIIRNGEIMPVDYDSTGIVQSSTSWSNGLHQFLQLKHNLKMTCETVTTNFLSNVGFIGRYRQIYGLTGTLGSKAARCVLKEVYKVDLVNIPQRREKQFVELEPMIEQCESDWLSEILSNVILEVQKNRGILVVCETIKHANRIGGMLKRKLRPSSVKLYIMNDMDQDKHVEKIVPGEVIIATNLAGRGTDIQTDEIEATGGLHVVLTFLPPNQRVEDQAFGRTARQGKRGTGIMILNAHSLIADETATNVKIKRDKIESEQLNEFISNELTLIQVKDKLFRRFCNFLNCEIREKIREKVSLLTSIKSVFTDALPTTEETCTLAAVEEQWASFLSKLDEEEIRCEDAENEYNKLCDRLKEDFSNGNIIKNPFYCITIANDILVNDWAVSSSKFKRALTYFEKALEIEKEHWLKEAEKQSSIGKDELALYSPGAAHVGVAWCMIHLKGDDYKRKALIALQTAFKCLLNEMSALNSVQLLVQQSQKGFLNSDLDKQLNIKSTILGSYIRGVESCIDAIKRSKRLIDVVAIRKRNKNDRFVETKSHFEDKEKSEVLDIVTKKLNPRSGVRFLLAFKHLTRRKDCSTRDQALETLRNVYSKRESSKDYCCLSADSYVRINIIQCNLSDLWSTLLNPHKNYKDLVRETAIAKLKEERSYMHACGLGKSLSTQLIIHSNGESKNLKYDDKHINQVIKIIEEQELSDTALRFDILIKDANVNEINKFFTQNVSEKNGTANKLQKSKSSEPPADGNRFCDQIEFKLNVTLENMSQEIAKEKLKVVEARSFNIEFVLHISALLELIETNKELEYGTLHRCDTEDFEKFDREELKKQLEKLKEDTAPSFIKFDNLSSKQAEKVIESCPGTVIFNIGFMNISHYFDSDLEEGQANVCFDKLNKNSAEVIINLLRDHAIEFSLEFCNLLPENVRSILKSASLDQEHIDVMESKNVKDLFMKNFLPTRELNEYASKGIEFIIVMNEKKFIPWRSVCAVAALGVAQAAVGGFLMMTGFSTSVGMGFVTEGIVDMIYAYRIYSTRQFKWSEYCALKAVSLTLSAVSMGMSKIKDAAKGIKTVTSSVGKEVLEQSGTQIISNEKAAATTLKTARANLKRLPWKNMGVEISKAVGKKALNKGVQYLSNFSLDSLKPKLCELVQSSVRRSFDDPELKCLLYKMHAIDTVTSSKQLQLRIEKLTADILEQDAKVMLWDSIGRPLIQSILSCSKFFESTVSNAFRTLTEEVVERLKNKLISVDKNSMTISLVLKTHLKISKGNSEIISSKMKKFQIFDDSDKFHKDCDINESIKRLSSSCNKENCDPSFEKLASSNEPILKDLQKSIVFVKQVYGAFVKIEMESFNEIMKAVSDQICERLIRVIDSKLLEPSILEVSGLVDSISSSTQHHHLINEKQNSDCQEADQKKYEELSKKDNLTREEKTFLTSYGKYRTFVEQQNYNSLKYCLAFSQAKWPVMRH